MASKKRSDSSSGSTVYGLIQRVADALEDAGISYMLVGGQAAILYGRARVTQDIDMTLGVAVDRFDDVERIAKKLRLKPVELSVSPRQFAEQTYLYPCFDSASGMRIDFMFSLFPFERQAIAAAKKKKIAGASIRLVRVEDLVVMKAVAGRPRDVEDITSLLAKHPKLDLAHVRHWLREHSRMLDEPILEQFDRLRTSIDAKLRRLRRQKLDR